MTLNDDQKNQELIDTEIVKILSSLKALKINPDLPNHHKMQILAGIKLNIKTMEGALEPIPKETSIIYAGDFGLPNTAIGVLKR